MNTNQPKINNFIIILSGKGGVGKSTICMNLAYGLAIKGYTTGILDTDIHGPSIAKMAGIETKQLKYDSNEKIIPIHVKENLYVVSIANILENRDTAVVWRGPMKMKFIRDILTQTQWPHLDYLIIDSPPGTGDEPLSVIQLLPQKPSAIIVTTPQSVAYLSVRKSISFCKELDIPIIGIIENMSGFICPYCHKKIDLFDSKELRKTVKDFNLNILGKIPIEKKIAISGDRGKPFISKENQSKATKEMDSIIEKIISNTIRL